MKCMANIDVDGRKSRRSVTSSVSDGTSATIPFCLITAISSFSPPFSFLTGEPDLVERFERPLCIQSAIDVIEKLTATSIALGRYVPILTKRLACMSK